MEESTSSESNDELPALSIIVSVFHILIFLICGLASLYATNESNFLHSYERLVFTLAFGAIGGTTNASRKVVRAVRHNDYKKNRLLWQILTPIHGAILACVGYIVLKGGIIALTTGAEDTGTYKYFIMGFSFFCGFSSELFIKRLIKASESLFGESNGS